VGLRVGLDATDKRKISRPYQESYPGCPARRYTDGAIAALRSDERATYKKGRGMNARERRAGDKVMKVYRNEQTSR
jgi:hypothetical protein